MLSRNKRNLFNQLVEVETLWGERKLSIGGRGRTYWDFVGDALHLTTPLIADPQTSYLYGSLPELVIKTNTKEVFKALSGFIKEYHPERQTDTLYIARILWLCHRQGTQHLFDKTIYLELHKELIKLEKMYLTEHELLSFVALNKSKSA